MHINNNDNNVINKYKKIDDNKFESQFLETNYKSIKLKFSKIVLNLLTL